MSAVSVVQALEKGAGVVGGVAGFVGNVTPWVNLVAGWFPGAASVLAAVQIAAPIIEKISVAAPIAVKALQAGEPLAAALDKSGPQMLAHLKHLYAVFANADPTRPETDLTAADVSDHQAMMFAGPVLFGRPWTAEEEARWFDKAANPGGG